MSRPRLYVGRGYHNPETNIAFMNATVRYYAVLIGGFFLDERHHGLCESPKLWSIIMKYTYDPTKQYQLRMFFDELLETFEPEELRAIASFLDRDLSSEAFLMEQLKCLTNRISLTPKYIQQKSYLGNLIKQVHMEHRLLELSEAINTWNILYTESRDFVSKVKGACMELEIVEIKRLLGPAVLQLPTHAPSSNVEHEMKHNSDFNTPGFNPSVALDLEKMQFLSHRNCDLALNNASVSKRGDELGLADLSYAYAGQGYLTSSLKALYEAFISDRLSLMREMKEDDLTPPSESQVSQCKARSRVWNRKLVGWLASLMTFYGRTSIDGDQTGHDLFAGIPLSLNYPLADLNAFLLKTANTEYEKTLTALHNLECLADGSLSPAVIEHLINMKKSYFNFSIVTNNSHCLQFSRLVSRFWWCFGFTFVAQNYMNMTLELCRSDRHDVAKAISTPNSASTNFTTNSASINVTNTGTIKNCVLQRGQISAMCDTLLRKGIYCDQIVEALWDLTRLKATSDWTDHAQITYSLLLATALLRCHALGTAKFVLNQLSDFTLPKTHQDILKYTEVELLMFSGKFYVGFITAQKYAQQYMRSNSTFNELFFLTKAARCLVLSQNPLYTAQCHILICKALERCLAQEKLGLVFELVLLRARLFCNSGKYYDCYQLCLSIQHLLYVSADRHLRCEWALLARASAAASNNVLEGGESVSTRDYGLSLYTEFNPDIWELCMGLEGDGDDNGGDEIQVLSMGGSLRGDHVGPRMHTADRNSLAVTIKRLYSQHANDGDESWVSASAKIVNAYQVFSRELQYSHIPSHGQQHTSTPIVRNHSPDECRSSAESTGNQKRIRETTGSPSRANTKRRSMVLELFR